MTFDWLIVGCGFTGSVLAERIATQLKQRVLIVEQRGHIGGNAYDCHNEDGVLVHRYGSHIFHTNAPAVWNYLSQFTAWRPYFHHVRASVAGKQIPIPFNLNSLYLVFPPRHAARLEELLLEKFKFGSTVPILKLRENTSGELRDLAEFVYENIFLHYTRKQWDLSPEELSPSVTARVPVSVSRDDRYFQDTYQAMPKHGYTVLFERMLNHPNIKILLNTDYREVSGQVKFKRMVYTGPIDAYFDRAHGALPYRSLRFQFETHPLERMLDVATVNYPNEHDFTRITEFKHMTGQKLPVTTVMFEYPEPHVPDANIPYYPVPRDETRDVYLKYEAEAKKLAPRVLFAGRLADYRYYNMDQAVARALRLFETEIVGHE